MVHRLYICTIIINYHVFTVASYLQLSS